MRMLFYLHHSSNSLTWWRLQGREGKIVQVYRKKWVIHIERITREKVNGADDDSSVSHCCCASCCACIAHSALRCTPSSFSSVSPRSLTRPQPVSMSCPLR